MVDPQPDNPAPDAWRFNTRRKGVALPPDADPCDLWCCVHEFVGTLFDRSCTDEELFSGQGNCSVCISESISRSSALHASRSQAASSAARVAATCSTAPPSPLAIYAQPPCTLTASWASFADTSLAIMNAAVPAKNKAIVPFNLKGVRFLRSRKSFIQVSSGEFRLV